MTRPMRMRELETRSGVGRETIRFYIREGLLPEPARAARNSASYSEAHITRLNLIKRLQEERFLPLAVIRGLLDGDDAAAPWLASPAFPGLDAVLRDRIDHDAPRVAAAALVADGGVKNETLDEAVATEVVSLDAAGTVSARDAAILKVLADLERIGFRRERGFATAGMIRMYQDFVDWITAQEMRLFVEGMTGHDEAEVADMAERGIGAVNELIGLMRTRALLSLLERRRRVASTS